MLRAPREGGGGGGGLGNMPQSINRTKMPGNTLERAKY